MPILNKKLALAKSRKTLTLDESDETQVVIKAVPMDKLLPMIAGDGALSDLATMKGDREEAINKLVKSGEFKFDMIRDVVLLAVVEPKLHDGPTDDEDLIDVDDISKYHMFIFQEAMEFSGLGEGRDARAFRPDGASSSSGSGGGGLRGETERAAGSPDGQPRMATAV